MHVVVVLPPQSHRIVYFEVVFDCHYHLRAAINSCLVYCAGARHCLVFRRVCSVSVLQ